MLGIPSTERLNELGVDRSAFLLQIPAGRLATTDEVGALAAFLASDAAG